MKAVFDVSMFFSYDVDLDDESLLEAYGTKDPVKIAFTDMKDLSNLLERDPGMLEDFEPRNFSVDVTLRSKNDVRGES